MKKDIDIGLIIDKGEFVLLHKHKGGWYEMFEKHGLDKKYKIKANFETYCYLRYMGFDAEAMFVEKIKKIDI